MQKEAWPDSLGSPCNYLNNIVPVIAPGKRKLVAAKIE
jgi:hypothetical protein